MSLSEIRERNGLGEQGGRIIVPSPSLWIGQLGRNPLRDNPRLKAFMAKAPRLANYIDDRKVELPPAREDFSGEKQRPMWGNDQYGDCTVAALANKIRDWCLANRLPFNITLQQVLDFYRAVSPNDQGAFVPDVLERARTVGLGSHKIEGYVQVNTKSPTEMQIAHHWFGGLYFGLDMPLAWQRQNSGVWFVPDSGLDSQEGNPAGWGGHAVDDDGYDERGVWIWTWGQPVLITWQALGFYAEECDAVLGPDWAAPDKVCPTGFAYQDLKSDLARLGDWYAEAMAA